MAGFDGWVVSMLGLLTMLVGSGLFALATLRTHSLSRGAAALLAVGAVAIVPSLGGLSGGLVPAALEPLAIALLILPFPAGWVALGVSAVRVDRTGLALEGAAP